MKHIINGLTTERIEAILNTAVRIDAIIQDIKLDYEHIVTYSYPSNARHHNVFVKDIKESTIPTIQLISEVSNLIINDIERTTRHITYGDIVSSRVRKRNLSHSEIINVLLDVLIERHVQSLRRQTKKVNELVEKLENDESQVYRDARRQSLQQPIYIQSTLRPTWSMDDHTTQLAPKKRRKSSEDVAEAKEDLSSDITCLLLDLFATNDKIIYKDLYALLNESIDNDNLFESRLHHIWCTINEHNITDYLDDRLDKYEDQYPLPLFIEPMVAIYTEKRDKADKQAIEEFHNILYDRSFDLIMDNKESALACLDHVRSSVSNSNVEDTSSRPLRLTSVKRSPLYDVALELATVSEDNVYNDAVSSMVTLLNKYRTIEDAPIIRLVYGKSTNRYMDNTSPVFRDSASEELKTHFKRFEKDEPMARFLLEFLNRSSNDSPNLAIQLNEIRDQIEDLDITSIDDERLYAFKEIYPSFVFIDHLLYIYEKEKEKKKQKKEREYD